MARPTGASTTLNLTRQNKVRTGQSEHRNLTQKIHESIPEVISPPDHLVEPTIVSKVSKDIRTPFPLKLTSLQPLIQLLFIGAKSRQSI